MGSGGFVAGAVFEGDEEEDEDDGGGDGGDEPDAAPGVGEGADGLREGEALDDEAGEPGADEHSGAVGEEGDESLGGGAEGGGGLAVDVNLAGDEEEVVADAVEEDAGVEHPDCVGGVSEGEEEIAESPGGHAGDEHVFDAEAAEEPWDEDHAEELGELPACHFAGGIDDADLVEEEVGEGVIELERDADEEAGDGEDGHGGVCEELDCLNGEDAGDGDGAGLGDGRGVRQGERVDGHGERGGGCQLHGQGGGLDAEVADEEAGDNPAGGAEDADGAELELG